MSTIPECIVAVHSGMKVMGLSTVTDACLPDALKPAHVEDIIKVAMSRESDRQAIVLGVIERLAEA
jgi:purine-nucleoside phosphorylase